MKVLLTGIQSYLALWPSKSILVFLPVRGWILVIFMMCLGISLKHIPGIPTEFFASFYYGLGPALIDAFGKSYRKKPYL